MASGARPRGGLPVPRAMVTKSGANDFARILAQSQARRASLAVPVAPPVTFADVRGPRLGSLGTTRLGGLGNGTTTSAAPPITSASFGPVTAPMSSPTSPVPTAAPALSATEQAVATAAKSPSRLGQFGMGVGGLAGGLAAGSAATAGANEFAGTPAEQPLRAAGAVAPIAGLVGPALAAKMGFAGAGALGAGITAPMVGAALGQAFSMTKPGNEAINAMRSSSDNPLANAAVMATPLGGLLKSITGVANEVSPGTFGRTDDTVLDVIPHGDDAAAIPPPTTAFAPGQGLDHLTQAMSEFGLRPDLQAQLANTFHQSLVMAKYQGGVSATGPDGKPMMITDPAQIEQALFEQTIAAIPQLAQQQTQEDDYNRRATIMQAELERALPNLIPQGPYDQSGTSSAPLANALRLIPAQLAAAQYQQDNRSLAAQIQSYQQQAILQQMGLTGQPSAAADPLSAERIAATGAVG